MRHRWLIILMVGAPLHLAHGQDRLPASRPLQAPFDVYALALSGDGKTLFTLQLDRTLRLWDLEKGTNDALHRFAAMDRPESLVLRPDGKMLVIVEAQRNVHVFDVAMRKMRTTLPGLSMIPGASARFSPDGKWLAISRGHEVEIYDAETLKSLQRIHAYQIPIHHVAFRPALKKDDLSLAMIASGMPKGQLWNVSGKRREMFFYSRNNESVGGQPDFRSDGKVLACAVGGKGDILLWDFSGDLPVADLPAKSGPVRALAFRSGSNHLAVARREDSGPRKPEENGIELWDVGTQKIFARTPLFGLRALAISADGNTLVAVGSPPRTIHVWDLSKLPAAPIGPVAKGPAGNLPETKDSYRAYLDGLLEVKGSDLPELVLDLLRDPKNPPKGEVKPGIIINGKPLVLPGLPQVAAHKHVSPLSTDMRFVKDQKDADIKDFRLGDLVEVSYASRCFPSTEIRVVEHDPARTRRQEGFVAAMKPLAPKAQPPFLVTRFDDEMPSLKRPATTEKQKAAEREAADVIFKLVDESPGDRQSFHFLSELMAMSHADVAKKAAGLMAKHQLKNERIKEFLLASSMRVKAPDELFERLLEQKEAPEHRAAACMVLANRWYHRARLSLDKKSKRVQDQDALALALRYHEQLKKEFAQEIMPDLRLGSASFSARKTAGAVADERLTEMRSVWAGLARPVPAGKPAPELVGIDPNGNKVKLSDFKGKVVLLRIQSYDPPKGGLPVRPKGPSVFELERSLMERFKDQPFVCVLVRWDAGDGTREFIKKENITWPVIRGQGAAADYNRQILQDWPRQSSPKLYLLDPEGNVRPHERMFGNDLIEAIEVLLQEKK